MNRLALATWTAALCMIIGGVALSADIYQSEVPDAIAKKTKEAQELRLQNKLADARAILESVVKEYPNYFLGHYNLGLTYGAQNENDAATAELERAQQINLDRKLGEPTIYNALGWIYFENSQYPKARAQFEMAMQPEIFPKLNSDSQRKVLNNLGLTWAHLGEPVKATQFFEMAAKLQTPESTVPTAAADATSGKVPPSTVVEQVRSAVASGKSEERSRAFQAFEHSVGFEIPPVVWQQITTAADVDRLLAGVQRPSIPQDMSKLLVDVLHSYLPQNDLYVDRIPLHKLNNALRELRKSFPVNDDPKGLLNATVFGSGDDCMLFGLKGIYFRTSWARSRGPKTDYIPYQKLATMTVRPYKTSEISLGSRDVFDVAPSSISQTKLVDILNSIRALFLLPRSA